MAHSDFIVDSLKASAYTAGLCALFGWADPKAAALGGLAAKVSGTALRSAVNYLWTPTSSDKENQSSVALMIVNATLIIAPILATTYAANYLGQQINSDYNYLQTSFQEFKVSCVLGVGSFVLNILLDETSHKSIETVISKEEQKAAPMLAQT